MTENSTQRRTLRSLSWLLESDLERPSFVSSKILILRVYNNNCYRYLLNRIEEPRFAEYNLIVRRELEGKLFRNLRHVCLNLSWVSKQSRPEFIRMIMDPILDLQSKKVVYLLIENSAVTEAALVSWFQGYQFPYSVVFNRHQKMTHRPTQVLHPIRIGDRRGDTPCYGRLCSFNSPLFPESRDSVPTLKVEMKEPGWKRIVTFDDSEPTEWSKGSQETFRRWRNLARAETPRAVYFRFRKGERKRDYHEHPYWFGAGTERSQV